LFRLRYTLTGLLALIGVIAATLASLRQLGFFDEDLVLQRRVRAIYNG
jgi:hypothetical protein